MKRVYGIGFAILVLLVTTSFAGTPDWVSGTSSKYPADKYLIGVGLSDSLDGSRSNARAEVAKIFKAQVTQKAQETQKEKTVQSGKKTATSSSIEASVNTQVSTDMQLEGVEIVETWFDPKRATQYALAVLDKQKLRTALAQQLIDQEQVIQAELSAAKAATIATDEIHAYAVALKAFNRKDEIVARKRVVDSVATPEVDAVSRSEVQQRQRVALNKVRFIVDAGEQRGVKELVSSKVAALGFKVLEVMPAAIGSETVLLLRCASATAPLERNNPQWKFYTYQCTVEILDWFNNEKVLTSDSKEGQASQLSDEAAKQKAILSIKQETAAMAEALINSYLFGE